MKMAERITAPGRGLVSPNMLHSTTKFEILFNCIIYALFMLWGSVMK